MNDTPHSSSPRDPPIFRFVEAGMRLTYEFESIGQVEASLGQSISFCPVFSARGGLDCKEFVASLQLRHLDSGRREIGRCLLDRDEIAAWAEFLRDVPRERGGSELRPKRIEYVSRHGVRMVWQSSTGFAEAMFQLYVASPQAAMLLPVVAGELLKVFEDFGSICRQRDIRD